MDPNMTDTNKTSFENCVSEYLLALSKEKNGQFMKKVSKLFEDCWDFGSMT